MIFFVFFLCIATFTDFVLRLLGLHKSSKITKKQKKIWNKKQTWEKVILVDFLWFCYFDWVAMLICLFFVLKSMLDNHFVWLTHAKVLKLLINKNYGTKTNPVKSHPDRFSCAFVILLRLPRILCAHIEICHFFSHATHTKSSKLTKKQKLWNKKQTW